MNFNKWLGKTKDQLKKLPTRELHTIANGTDIDASRVANDILKERVNEDKTRSVSIGATEADFEE